MTYVEQDFTDAKNTDMGKRIAECFAHEEICFGGKSMRGYGKIGDVKVAEREFDLSNEVSMNQWIDFDLYSDSKDNWSSMDLSEDNNKKSSTIRIQIKQQGGISIRRYTTKVSTEDETQPDMEQLTIKRAEGDHDETPVIPGTSWAGAFRHRMKEFGIDVEGKDSIFGTAIGEKSRSKICFGETQLTGGNYKTISRNSIDRFSGGAVETALFTERTYYDGKGELEISWNPLKKESMPENEMKALAASLADLHYGFLAIGGETSIRRGLFQIEKINNESVLNNENIYELILKEIEGAF